jgi:uncharacterized protein YndB with AHSA1/START domain
VIEVSTTIAASPGAVWERVGDPTRMGEWSPECRRVEWARGSATPALGARFRGHNRIGRRRWTTAGTVTTYEPGRAIAWDVTVGPLAIARWAYRLEPADGGAACVLTESFTDRRGPVMRVVGRAVRGIRDLETHNRAGMEHTLARIKAAAGP